MKFGPRKPSLKKSIKARTTGRMKRQLKKITNPLYGKKGMGWINNPKKALYNKAYNKTSFSLFPSTSGASTKKENKSTTSRANTSRKTYKEAYVEIAQNHLKAYNESQELFLNTTNPETFFSRYDTAMERLDNYIEMISVNDVIVQGDDVFEIRSYYSANKELVTKDFINRYYKKSVEHADQLKTEKGRNDNLERSKNDLLNFSEQLGENNINYIERLWENGSIEEVEINEDFGTYDNSSQFQMNESNAQNEKIIGCGQSIQNCGCVLTIIIAIIIILWILF